MNTLSSQLASAIRNRFSLKGYLSREKQIVEELRQGSEFGGLELWILIFAIFIASIGLNVNSTAVVIGAMLISPLMGPIMGVGLGVGISDIELIKKAGRNLSVMVIASIGTSALYFLISPLQEAQSELLARTTPTTWDVFIGLFGGLAGIVATSSKQRGNVIPGVAIATALMPPLCTAGYGLATGSLKYFAGAFYLFSINAVFIWLSTVLVVRFLRFKEVSFVTAKAKKRVRTFITLFIIVMVIPSIYIARNLVIESLFEEKAVQFIQHEFNFQDTYVFRHEQQCKPEKKIIVSLIGPPLDENTLGNIRNQLKSYGLEGTELVIKQGDNDFDAADIKSKVLEEYFARNLDSLKTKEETISALTRELYEYKRRELPIEKLFAEAIAIEENIRQFSVEETIVFDKEKMSADTLHLAVIKYRRYPRKTEINRFQDWLKVRIESDSIKIVIEQ